MDFNMGSTLEDSRPKLSSNSILVCSICQKPFTKELSYNRHILYCRRTHDRPRVRNKACQACSITKTKCSFQTPCQRCKAKRFDCRYDQPKDSAVASSSRQEFDDPTAVPHSPSALRINLPAGGETQIFEELQFDNAFEPSSINPQIDDELMQLVAFNDDSAFHFPFGDKEISSVSESLTTTELQPFHQGSPTSAFFHETENTFHSFSWPANNNHFPVHSMQNSNYRISLRLYDHVVCLTRLQIPDPVARHSARLTIQALCAYPLMMLRRETFPPFIHPHWHRQSTPALPIPLANCMSIAQLFASRTAETKAFLWQTVKTESQRFRDEMKSFSNEELLAAMQAQLIYIIMRFVDEATQPADLNLQMLISFRVLCDRFREINNESFADYQVNPCTLFRTCTSWESWIFAESSLRTAIVFFLISRIASLYTGIMCSVIDQYHHLPLCSAKTIWEAKTRTVWASEYAAYTTHTQSADLSTVGQLIVAQGMSRDPIKSQALDSWNTRADNLGNLLNTAIGLVHA